MNAENLDKYRIVDENGELLNDTLADVSYELNAQAQKEAHKEAMTKKSPYNKWAQLNLEHSKELMELSLSNGVAHAILYLLVDQMDSYNAVMISSKVIEEITGKSRPTVARAIKHLKDKGFINILKSGNSNVYTINDKVYWKSYGKNMKFSKFPANVVLSASEQIDLPKSFETIKTPKTKTQKNEA